MSWITAQATEQQTLSQLPELRDKYLQLYQTVWQLPAMPAITLDLCRLRIAQLHRCEQQWHKEPVLVNASQRENLADWASSTLFNDAEKACLAFSEVYAMDCNAITDEHADAVKAYYGDAGLVALIEALGLFDGMTRLSLLWQVEA